MKLRSILVVALVAVTLSSCTGMQLGASPPGSSNADSATNADAAKAKITITPAEQCLLSTAIANGLQTTALLSPSTGSEAGDLAISTAVDTLKAAAADYCLAVSQGRSQSVLDSLLAGFNAADADLNVKLAAAKASHHHHPPATKTSCLKRSTASTFSVASADLGGREIPIVMLE